jgi:hypothetical protein
MRTDSERAQPTTAIELIQGLLQMGSIKQVYQNRVITERPKLGIAVADWAASLSDDRCGIVSDQANAGALSSREELEKMARRRFQRGSVTLRGKRARVWVGRWRDDVINPEGKLVRINRKEVLGTKGDFPTKKLALRELGLRIAPINSTNYRARFAGLEIYIVRFLLLQTSLRGFLADRLSDRFGRKELGPLGSSHVPR